IDAIATWDWVLKDRDDPTDPRLGTIGYSYAGAMQLMTSIFDDRIDAMVPEMTWHNITTALAPNGVIKSGWVGLFYLAGNSISPITFSNDFHQGWTWAMSSNELPAGQLGVVPDLVTEFNEASPEFYPDGLTVPTRLIQSPIDTLFPLNQAVWNYDQLKRNGAPVQLYTYLGGHVLHTDSLYGESPIGYGAGLQGAPGGWPCGGREELGIEWHQKWLLELDVDTGRDVCISLEDGTPIYGDDFPLPGTDFQTHDIAGPLPVVQAAGAGSLAPLLTLEFPEATTVAGIPRLSGSITAPGPDTIVYFSFYKQDTSGLMEHIVDDQVRPLRIAGPNTGAVDFDIELGGIATHVPAGESLVLVVSSVEPMFFGNSQRLPSGTVLENLQLTLPVIPAPQFS
ncbi:MAG: CocE/NonD family hydrolase, partial [Thermoplasmatota archaeon]